MDRLGFDFERVNISSQSAMEAPAKYLMQDNNGVNAYGVLIPQTYNTATLVYFVSGNGDEYGQFARAEDALAKATKIASMTREARRFYDE